MAKSLNKHLTEIEQLDTDELRLSKIQEFLDELGHKELELAFPIIDFGMQLDNIDPKGRFILLEKKYELLLSNGLTKRFKELHPVFDELLKQFPQFIAYKVSNARYRILALFDIGKRQEAIEYGESVIAEFDKYDDKEIGERLIEIYRITGGLHTVKGNYAKCFEYLKIALNLTKMYELKAKQLHILSTLGDIFRNNFDAKKGIGYLKQGLELEKEVNSVKHKIGLLKNLGLCYIQLNQNDKAKNCLEEAYSLCKETNDKRTETTVAIVLAEVYVTNNELGKFNKIKDKLVTLAVFKNNEAIQSDAYIIFSDGYIKMGDYKQALYYCDLYEKIKLKLNGFIDLHNAYENKITIYKALSDYKNAALYYEKIIDLRQKILSQKSKAAFEEFEAKFQNERKEKEINSLKLESVSYQLQSLRTKMDPGFIHKTIESVSEDINENNIAESKDMLHSFARLMRAKLQFAEDELITIEEEIQFLNDYIKLEQLQLTNGLDFSIIVNDELDLDFIELPSMLIQPYVKDAINNSLHSLPYKAQLTIEFKENEDESLSCYIRDNGIPRDEKKNKAIDLPEMDKSSNLIQVPHVATSYELLTKQGQHVGTMVSLTISF